MPLQKNPQILIFKARAQFVYLFPKFAFNQQLASSYLALSHSYHVLLHFSPSVSFIILLFPLFPFPLSASLSFWPICNSIPSGKQLDDFSQILILRSVRGGVTRGQLALIVSSIYAAIEHDCGSVSIVSYFFLFFLFFPMDYHSSSPLYLRFTSLMPLPL